jgi:ubiquinone/menaquinone biosynthesis C-methylase UbiE
MEVAVGALTFDEHAEKYDSWFMKNPNVLASEVCLIKHVLGDPGRTLSVGCGSGLFEGLLKRDHGITIHHGVEPAQGMARIAGRRGLDVRIGTAEDVPFKDGSFDTVLMNGTPAYLRDLRTAFQEAQRVLKPGGHVVIGDVPASSSYGMLYQLAGLIGTWDDARLRKIAPQDPYPVEFVQEANWRTTEEISVILCEVGFQDLEYAQTLTTHARFSNNAVEEPVEGYDRGGYVAIRARKE